MTRSKTILLLTLAVLQSACIGVSSTRQYPRGGYPDESGPYSRGERADDYRRPPEPRGRYEESDQAPEREAPSRQAAPESPAILALRDEAQANVSNGDLDSAAATLERAIRIQPRNGELWHELADVRLRQQQPGLAEDLAKKSNLHARGDRELERKNWALIAEARRQKGDLAGAADADQRASE